MRPTLFLLAVLWPGLALGATATVTLREADHPGFGRLVLQMSGDFQYQVTRDGAHATVSVTGSGVLPSGGRLPRNFLGAEGSDGTLALSLAKGSRLNVMRMGDRLVMDAFDAKSDADTAAPPVVRGNSADTGRTKVIVPAAALVPPPALPAASEPAEDEAPKDASPAGAAPVNASSAVTGTAASAAGSLEGPVQIAVSLSDMPAGVLGHAILVPFENNVGAAAFPRGNREIVVFDEASPLDVSQIADDPVFGGAKVTVLEDGTVLSLPEPAQGGVRLMRVDAGWLVLFEDRPSALAAIEPMGAEKDLFLPGTRPTKTITIADEMTGENLFVGTQVFPGQAVPVRRQAPEYRILPSDMGVAVEPVSDRLSLLAEKDGFLLSVSGKGPDLTLPASMVPRMAEAAGLRRLYDFPPVDTKALFRRLQSETVTSALSPPLSRFEPRYQVAQTMVGLGLDAEAQSVMQLAIQSDASHAGDADAKGLEGIAATLAGRFDEAGGLEDPALSQWDDVKLWRALRGAMRNEGQADPDAAAAIAAASPIILTYPEPLQERIAHVAVETMALGGQLQAARALAAARPNDPKMALGNAIIAEKSGDIEGALSQYDALDLSRDRDARAWAAERAVELRLAAGKIGPAEAADAFEQQFLNWRGDERELALRERAAELRARSGNWRDALALLREAEAIYPDNGPELQDKMAATLVAMLRSGAPVLPPLDVVELADENATLIAQNPHSDELAAILADKLIELDLPDRAAPVLGKLMNAASGTAKARLGAKLAEVDMDRGDARAALAAVQGSATEGLPDDLTAERATVQAKAAAALGNIQDAAQDLVNVTSPDGMDVRARIYENAKDWGNAETALATLAARAVPASGDLSDTQRDIMLRLASAASQAGDAGKLQVLRAEEARMGSGDRADMFKLLVAQPVKDMEDLPRAKAEDRLASSVPGAIGSLQ